MKNRQKEKVKQYFDKIADTYSQRFSENKIFHQNFFRQRLNLATKNLELKNKKILDIGAGTGSLYDYLMEKKIPIEYFATDISASMLAQSSIPHSRQFVGDLEEIDFLGEKFDFIFLLGVTSYFEENEFVKILDLINNHLSQNGCLIVSFTNKTSIDFRFRRVLKPFFKLIKKGLLSQDFSIKAYPISRVSLLLEPFYKDPTIVYFNFTCTPFNQLFSKLSIRISNWIIEKQFSMKIQQKLGADFIVSVRKK
jgi:ubiquinone/menaquinone biosynthesis C-methylase UbiE